MTGPRRWYLMTRHSISRSPDLWFESSHATRDSCRAKAARLLAEPLRGGNRGVVEAQVWWRGNREDDPRTEAERIADRRLTRPGWDAPGRAEASTT